MKILVVEDEANIRQILKYNLELDGHEVSLAVNGRDALEKIVDVPDLILLDLMMPVMGGLELCGLLKSQPETRNIPILMLTAKTQEQDIREALNAGADGYLTKPFEPEIISSLIDQKLKKRGL